MKISKEYIAIIVLIILCGIFAYIAFGKDKRVVVENPIVKARYDSLEKENQKLTICILTREKEDLIRDKKLDSITLLNTTLSSKIETLKSTIIRYEKYKSININASADSMRSILPKDF